MTLLFICGVGVYFLFMALIGYLASRRVKTMEDYLLAGRRLPFYLAVPTIVATWFGAGSSMGVSGMVYTEGFYGVISDPFGCAFALIIAGLFFAAPFRRMQLMTVSDLLGRAYGPLFERIATLVVFPFYVGTLASQMLAMGYVFQIVTGLSLELGIGLGAIIVLIYTVSGGMWAVTITDFIQFALLSISLVLIVGICFEQVPDKQLVVDNFFNEFSNLLPSQSRSTDLLAYAGRILMTALGAIMGQDLIQRILSSRSEKVARSSTIIGGSLYLFLGLIPLFIGIAGRQIYPALEKPELLIPFLAKDFLSPVLFTLFSCGLFSAIMSTADSYLLAGTSLITHNVLLKIWPVQEERAKIHCLRLVNITMTAVALALAFSGQSVFNLMVHSGATLFIALFVPASMALFRKSANAYAGWSAMSVGILTWGFFIFYYRLEYLNRGDDLLFSAAAFGALCSLLAYLSVDLIYKKREQLIRFKDKFARWKPEDQPTEIMIEEPSLSLFMPEEALESL